MNPRSGWGSGWGWAVVVGSSVLRVKYSGGGSNDDADLSGDAELSDDDLE
jgi:hypothetical protein